MKGTKVSRKSVEDRKDSRKESRLKRLLRLLPKRRSAQAEGSHSAEQPAVQDFHTLSPSPAPSIFMEAPTAQPASDFAQTNGDGLTEEKAASSSVDDSIPSRNLLNPKIIIDSQFSLAMISPRSSASAGDSRNPELGMWSRNRLRPKIVIDSKFNLLRRVADANEVQYTLNDIHRSV